MHTTASSRRLLQAGFLLGFALGGFFDGILLHQVLQWHHLLSGVDAVRDLRTQVLADGLFHALMYLLAFAGLAMLWRTRAELPERAASELWALALIGFGTWHVVDTLLSHWITGIHRIRQDADNPLFWDLLWLVAFGLVPLVAGWLLRRRGGGRGGRPAAAALAVAALVAAPVAALGPNGSDEVLVLFRPGTSGAAAFEALARVDARVRWVDASGGLWAVRLPQAGAGRQLYAAGALLVTDTPLALGCVSFTRTAL